MIQNTLNEKQLPVYGDGMNIREWFYVEAQDIVFPCLTEEFPRPSPRPLYSVMVP